MLTPPPSTMPVMPRLFISRKNFAEPSTCWSNVGFGTLSKILPSALPLADHHAGRLVVAVAFELAAGGTSASSWMFSASIAFGDSSTQS